MTVEQSWILFWMIAYIMAVTLIVGSFIIGKLILDGLTKIKRELIEYLTD